MSRVVHFEIHAKDPDAMQRFYEGLFGWSFQGTGEEFGGYRVIMTGTDPIGINGGMMRRQGENPADGAPVNAFVCIVGVEDVDATFEKGKALGGAAAVEPMDIPTVGRLAYLKDPDGNIFGILKPTMPPAGQ